MVEPHLTERQEKWFASVRAGLERDTGRSMEAWTQIALTCPETAPRARLKWFKDVHGLAQNRASMVLAEAFGRTMAWSEPEPLINALWADPAARAIFDRVRAQVMTLPDVIMGSRKLFTAFSRKVQFCALRPVKGEALMGLCAPIEASPRLSARGRESWSERLPAKLVLASPEAVDAELADLLRLAWDAS